MNIRDITRGMKINILTMSNVRLLLRASLENHILKIILYRAVILVFKFLTFQIYRKFFSTF